MGAYERVIVGLDLLEATVPLMLTRACQVAEPSAIELIHVCEHLHHSHINYNPETAFRNSELDAAVMGERARYLEQAGEPFRITRHSVLDGHPVVTLHELAASGADLIVVGTHGRHGWRAMLGSTANAVLHGTPCSVLAVRIPDGEPVVPGPYRRVLVAVNLEEESGELIQHAQRITARSQGSIVLGHVIPTSDASQRGRAEARLRDLAESFALDPESASVVEGRRAAQLHALAQALEADLVVVGTRGKHGVELITGSTANAVLHGSSCDTLSVRT